MVFIIYLSKGIRGIALHFVTFLALGVFFWATPRGQGQGWGQGLLMVNISPPEIDHFLLFKLYSYSRGWR
jgi:hypothetical protein